MLNFNEVSDEDEANIRICIEALAAYTRRKGWCPFCKITGNCKELCPVLIARQLKADLEEKP